MSCECVKQVYLSQVKVSVCQEVRMVSSYKLHHRVILVGRGIENGLVGHIINEVMCTDHHKVYIC